jgi:predicted nucleotidyltransferase component of viral defense system
MQQFYRTATSDEIRFYEEKLYPLQDLVFEIASVYEDQLYLTGGTALARFHFNHRFSEDLYFFTDTDDLKRIATDLTARLKDSGFSIEIERSDVYFVQVYIITNDCRLKIDFVKAYNRVGGLQKTDKGVYINDLEDIGANKITAFEDRAEIKDIIDLYRITQKIPIERLFELAELKRIPVAYEQLLTINAQGISGRALLTQDLDEVDFSRFVDHLKSKTEAEIKKKERITLENLPDVINRLLWDFPREERNINPYSIPVLRRRLNRLPLPSRSVLERELRH